MTTTVRENDLSKFWMPFTANRDFHKDPRLVTAADGMYYTSADGRRILDGTAGLWCVNAGHARPRIVEAVQRQIATLDYAPPFNFAHPQAFDLSARLARMFPGSLDHVFFTNSGSESVDTALKIALHYHRMRGDGARTRLIGRERGYHGVGFGGISVGGIVKNRAYFGSLLTGVDHMRHTHDLGRNAFSRGCPEHGAELADDLTRLASEPGPLGSAGQPSPGQRPGEALSGRAGAAWSGPVRASSRISRSSPSPRLCRSWCASTSS